MKKLIIMFFAMFLYASDIEIDFGKVAMDGIIEGMNTGIDLAKKAITDNELLKKENPIDEKDEKSDKFSNLKIDGKWELAMDRVYTSFLGYVANKWEIDFKKNKEVYLFGKKKNYIWNYENDVLKFKTENQGYFSDDKKIKFIKSLGDNCFKVLYNNAEAKMCKLSGGLAKDKSKAIKIEIK